MASRQQRLRILATTLERDLRVAHDRDLGLEPTGAGPLIAAFHAFGRGAAKSSILIEDAMSAAVEALQSLFEVTGGMGSDPSTIKAAGLALAEVAKAYQAGTASPNAARVTDPSGSSQIARLSALHQINRAATANLELVEMLDTVVHVVAETTKSDACEVFLYDDTSGLLTLKAAIGLNPASINAVTIRLGTGITGRAAIEARVIAAPDARSHESFHAHPGLGEEMYTSQVSVPLMLQGQNRLVGILNIHSIYRREYDQDELEFLQTVAGELAISIANALRYSSTDERLRQKVAELGTLQRVSRLIASTLDLRAVIRLISEQAMELIHAEAAAIFRLDPQRNGQVEEAVPTIDYRVGPSRELIDPKDRDDLVRDVMRSGMAKGGELRFTDGVNTMFCVPLRTAREGIGALCFRLNHNTEPDADTLGILQAFSDSAAMAIENAQLYQDAMHSIQTQSALVQEMHHRVRNNLQTVAALLSLQLRTAQDAPWATEIREAISRIQSIAAVHDLLSDEKRLGGTTLDVIARLVAEDAHSTLIPSGLAVRFEIVPSDLRIPSRQATIISLLINELAANAISHGFEERHEGVIRIRGWQQGGHAHIEVYNDGQGVPDGFDPAESSGLGMRITQRLVTSDLKGTFSIASNDVGTTALIRFPIVQELGS